MYDEGCSCTVQMLKVIGIDYSSPTMASAMSDLLPAFTFVLAIICRCTFPCLQLCNFVFFVCV